VRADEFGARGGISHPEGIVYEAEVDRHKELSTKSLVLRIVDPLASAFPMTLRARAHCWDASGRFEKIDRPSE
jgi:hypothetical protein